MSVILNEITPQDSYIVYVPRLIELTHTQYLIQLYQPIIGTDATSFYMTLLNHVSIGQVGFSTLQIHRQLMSQMYLSFSEIIKARKQLEAVGLLKTKKYKHKQTEQWLYEYKMIPPLTPNHFLQSDILSVLLLNRVGKSVFEKIQKRWLIQSDWNHEYIGGQDITKSFDEVFDTVLASELTIKPGSELEELLSSTSSFEEIEESKPIQMKHQYLDMDYIKGMVSNLYELDKALNKEIIMLLQELAFTYQLTEMDMIHILQDPIIYDKYGKLDQNELRKGIRTKYKGQKKEVVVVEKEQKKETNPPKTKSSSTPQDKSEKHKWVLENYSPMELMQKYQGGGKVPDADVKLIEGLIFDYQLPMSVVNVLIEYVMLSNEYKLPRSLTEKIAGHWKRLKISTVDDAKAVARKEHQLYKSWKEPKKQSSNTAKGTKKRTNTKKDNVPDYILKQEAQYHQNEQPVNQIDENKQKKINQLLKDLGEID